jgi:signal recognition particle receptor subunit beta
MFINHASKQVTAKIVYYGPGLSGKTTNLQYIFSVTNPKSRGELVSIETDIERTLFFDLLPINVGLIKGYQTKFQLYTVPGQVFYDATRKLVLKGADGIVFVADSQELMEEANVESYENLLSNLADQNQSIDDMPLVFQYNKRDLNRVSDAKRLDELLNALKRPRFEAVATSGGGVLETLREISTLTLEKIKELIEHSSANLEKRTPIQFDTNQDKEIIQKEDLPLKKISVDNVPQENAPENQKKDLEVDFEEIPLELDEYDENSADPPAPTPPPTPTPAPTSAPTPTPPTSPTPAPQTSKFEVLDNLGDRTRMTMIKKIRLKDSGLQVELKDSSSQLIDSLNLKIDPEIKKITLILDVKR